MNLIFILAELLIVAVTIPEIAERRSRKQTVLFFKVPTAIVITLMFCLMASAIMFLGFDFTRQHDRIAQCILGLIYGSAFVLYLFMLNNKIFITDEHLHYRTMFRRTKAYSLAQISQIVSHYSGINKSPSAHRIILLHKTIRLENFWSNFKDFLPCLKKHLKKAGHSCEFIAKINGVDLQRSPLRQEKNVILRQPRATAIISALFTLLATIYTVIFILDAKDVAGILVMGVFWLSCFLWFCGHFTWKIELIAGEPYFLYRPYIGKTRSFVYHDIIQYEESHNLLILKTPSEKIRVPVASSNFAYLLQVLKENRVCKV